MEVIYLKRTSIITELFYNVHILFVDIQQYAGTFSVPRRQVSPFLREIIGVSRLTAKVQANLGDTALQIKPNHLLGRLGYQYNWHSSKQ